jgi:sterol desaturase/sphingolipid hydroxylase (fatty acid hydroxylase superfamily)
MFSSLASLDLLTFITTSPFQWSNHMQFFLFSWFIIIIAFYLHSWLYLLADWGYFGQWVEKYAIRSGKHRYASMKLQYQAIYEATLDTFLIKPLILYFCFPYLQNLISFDLPTAQSSLPSPEDSNNTSTFPLSSSLFSSHFFFHCFYDWILLNFLFSTSLYFIHSAFHSFSFLYKNFHKKHHLFTSTIGFTSLYAHPIESLASAFHFIGPILLIKPSFITYLLYLISVTIEFVDSHCGYDVPWGWVYPWAEIYPWGSGARIHDYHHSHNLGAYGGGVFGIWDRLFQTDADYRLFEQKRRTRQTGPPPSAAAAAVAGVTATAAAGVTRGKGKGQQQKMK